MRFSTGTVVRFDETRGYGFIAPDDGGEDVFMHANALIDEKEAFVPGAPVQFEATGGERGLKALSVRILRRDAVTSPPTRQVPPRSAQAGEEAGAEEDGLCDVLSQAGFTRELTEMLLETSPTLTGAQILQIRAGLVALARKHGWVED